jgi:hypothetical protein
MGCGLAATAVAPRISAAAPPPAPAKGAASVQRVLAFQKIKISDDPYEAAAAFDVNNDGQLDIVCGAWWYPGPKFDKKCPVGTIKPYGDNFDDMAVVPMDINGDGYIDFVTSGWFGRLILRLFFAAAAADWPTRARTSLIRFQATAARTTFTRALAPPRELMRPSPP